MTLGVVRTGPVSYEGALRLQTCKILMSRRIVAMVLVVVAAIGIVACGDGPASPPVTVDTVRASPLTGIQDDSVFQLGQDPAERVRAMADAGAAIIRVDLLWSQVAQSRPADATNPDDPAYRWQEYDRLIEVAKANKLHVLFAVYGTPEWAADPSVTLPKDLPFAFARRPQDPGEFGAFATAAATRYAPRGVTRWEGWNEPNINLFLYPQYERQGRRWVATSPRTYADLQRSFYEAIKAVDPSAVVAGGATAPTGDRCGSSCRAGKAQPEAPNRVAVPDFLDALDQPDLQPPMDVVSHHPYPRSAPREPAPPNRTSIDLYNLRDLTAAIDRTYLRGAKIWLTEYGWGTKPVPQNPKYFSPEEQARFIVDAFERVRATPRVEMLIYYFLRDHAAWSSGLLDDQGVPKPSLAAHALPFGFAGATPPTGPQVRLTGQARAATGRTQVRVEWKSGDDWRKLTVAETGGDGTFAVTVRPEGAMTVRAVWKGRTRSGADLTWTSPEVALPGPSAP